MKNTNKIFLALLASFVVFFTVFAEAEKNITDLTILDSDKLSFNIWDNQYDVDFEKSDFKVLENIDFEDLALDEETQKVMITLSQDNKLLSWSLYSVFFEKWSDLGLDFVYSPNEENIFEYVNSDVNWDIQKIKILDGDTIEVTLKDIQNYELLNLMKIFEKVDFKKEDKFVLQFNGVFSPGKEYVLIVSDLKNKNGEEIKLWDYIYFFEGKENNKINEEGDISWNVEEENPELNTWIDEDNLELNAWTGEEILDKEPRNIEEVAQEAKTTPATWTPLNILFIMTLFLTFLLFARKKLVK